METKKCPLDTDKEEAKTLITRIIADINQMKQPDKVWLKQNEVVVIDFKTGLRQDSHMTQIISYAKLLETIFRLPVRPFLYYSQLDLFLELWLETG